ncbi:MAG: response regulator, partial [Lentisphaerae bacterium]|nr:response regulator [Lentisphaerota bacterium]
LIRQLRALRPECPIVVITGYPSETSIKECQQLGVHDFLTKPFEMPFISSILNRLAPIPDKSRPKVTS